MAMYQAKYREDCDHKDKTERTHTHIHSEKGAI